MWLFVFVCVCVWLSLCVCVCVCGCCVSCGCACYYVARRPYVAHYLASGTGLSFLLPWTLARFLRTGPRNEHDPGECDRGQGLAGDLRLSGMLAMTHCACGQVSRRHIRHFSASETREEQGCHSKVYCACLCKSC